VIELDDSAALAHMQKKFKLNGAAVHFKSDTRPAFLAVGKTLAIRSERVALSARSAGQSEREDLKNKRY
jgi:hypothetical protein